MSNLKKIFYLLTKKEKYNLTVISVFNFIGILFEMLSFAINIPVFKETSITGMHMEGIMNAILDGDGQLLRNYIGFH